MDASVINITKNSRPDRGGGETIGFTVSRDPYIILSIRDMYIYADIAEFVFNSVGWKYH